MEKNLNNKKSYIIPGIFALSLFLFVEIGLLNLLKLIKDKVLFINSYINISQNLIINMIFYAILLTVYIIWFKRLITGHKAILNQERFPVFKSIVIAAGLFGMTVIVRIIYNNFVVQRNLNVEGLNSLSILNIKSHNLIIMISFILLIPIIEELLFRGILFNYIENSKKGSNAVFLSSFIYGIVHINFLQFIIYFCFGYAMAIIYRKTRSLLMPVLIHIIYNFMIILTLNFTTLTKSDSFKYMLIFLIIPTFLMIKKCRKETMY